MPKRSAGMVLALLTLMPAAAFAQKPSKSMWTRSAELYVTQGQQAAREDEKASFFHRALDQAQQSIEKQPQNPAGYFYAGEAYIGLGQYAQADSMLDKAEQMYPDYKKDTAPIRERAWADTYNKAIGQVQANNPDSAIALLQTADALYQGRPAAKLTLAGLYQNKGDTDKAVEEYRAALETLHGAQPEGLTPDMQKKWSEDESRATQSLAQLLLFQKKYDEAAQVFKDYLAKHPDDVQAKLRYAVALDRSGKKDEANQIFSGLAGQSGLNDQAYFAIGVSLFGADKYDEAANAFRKAMAANPYNRDAAFDLSQTLLAQARALEEGREKATTPAEKQKYVAQLNPLYDELLQTTDKVLAADPNSASTLRLAAASARGKGDIATADADAAKWKQKALGYLQQEEKLAVAVSDVQVTEGDNGVQISGSVTNKTLAAGTPVKISFQLLDKSGATVDTQEITVAAPAKDQKTTFQATSKVKDSAGWKYTIAQ